MATDLYPLPPTLKPCEPVDSSYIRYLNHSHSPIINSLSKPLNIDFYNDIWFDKPPRTSQPLFDYNHPSLAFPDDQLTPFTSFFYLHIDTNTITPSPLIENSDTNILSPSYPLVLSKYFCASDGIFFTRYSSLYRSIMWKLPSWICVLILRGVVTSHFWRDTLMIIICAMIEYDGGLNGTSIS